jgi:N-acetylglutamate synthase-like GNAT family acetyltransferase
MVRQRRATAQDLANVRHLRQAAIRVLAAETYDPAALESLIEETGTDAADLIEMETLHVLELDGEIVACGGWWTSEGRDRASIECIHVDPGFAREGLASRVLAIVEAEVAGWGHREVEVSATLNAMPFFTAMGYRPERVVRGMVEGSPCVVGVVMAKRLTARVAAAA